MTVGASVVGRFPVPDDGLALSIEPDLDPYSDGLIHLLLFPADQGISVYASIGDVLKSGTKDVPVPSGVVQFSGSSTAHLPHRPYGNAPAFQTFFAFDTEGSPTTIGLSYDGNSNVLTATEDCYAAVKYEEYTTQAIRLTYRPLSQSFAGGVSVKFGVIAAFRPPRSIVIYEVSPFLLVDGNVHYEIYKITSKTVSTPTGEHELPNNFPANPGTYTGSVETLDTSVAMENKRVHEIGYMDEAGRGWAFAIFHGNVHPFVGDNNYVPTKTLEPAVVSLPENLRLKALNYIASRGLARA